MLKQATERYNTQKRGFSKERQNINRLKNRRFIRSLNVLCGLKW